jgi:small subunit ribosomal protein S20
VAHSLSAKKRVRQDARRRGRNRWRKAQVRDAVRAFQEAMESGDKAKASEQLKQACRTLDKNAAKGTIHRNAADRKKSRLHKAMNKLA